MMLNDCLSKVKKDKDIVDDGASTCAGWSVVGEQDTLPCLFALHGSDLHLSCHWLVMSMIAVSDGGSSHVLL